MLSAICVNLFALEVMIYDGDCDGGSGIILAVNQI